MHRSRHSGRWLLVAWVLCLLLAAPGAAAEAPRLSIITTEFVLEAKLRDIQARMAEAGTPVRYHYVERAGRAELAEAFAWADLVVLDAPRESDARRVAEATAGLAGETPALLVTISGPVATGLDGEDTQRLYAYYRNGGLTNFGYMADYLLALAGPGARDTVPAAVELPDSAYYHPALPQGHTRDLAAYPGWEGTEDGRPVVGVLMHQSNIGNLQTGPVDDLMERLAAAGARPLALYAPMDAEDGLQALLSRNGDTLVDVLINFQPMYMDQRRDSYQALDVPVLQAITWRAGDAEHWRRDPVGIPLGSVPFYLAMPEAAGAIDPLVAAAVEQGRTVAIPEQMQSLADKAVHLARLRHLANDDKRLALFYYNYPSGERNLSASFLNVPRSLERLTAALAEAGYDVAAMDEDALIEQGTALLRPFYREGALEPLLEAGLAGLLPMAEYRRWLDALPASPIEAVTERWGEPEASPMVLDVDGEPQFVIPLLRNGKLLIMPQPPRGRRGEDAEGSIYHDARVPLNHFYMAAYLYLRETFGADALIHFGTHGTQEWTPGKERGLGIEEYPYLVLGNLPVFYPYIVDNIGEATQAKRRGRATIVSHQTPPFRPAGLHQELMPIHDLIHDYEMLDDGPVRERTREAILEELAGDDLFQDLGWDLAQAATDFDAFQLDLHDYLHELARQAQPLGLHAFGISPEPAHRLGTVMQMLGGSFYALLDLDESDELFVDDSQDLRATPPMAFLQRHLIDGNPLPESADTALVGQLALARDYHDALAADSEIRGLLDALDGRFLAPGGGGDPIRRPDSLPTGRNLYGFDPSRLPTRQAYETGRAAMDTLIEEHHAAHGSYPRKLAFSLWAVEAMRHLGVLEAQVFHALGVRPQWDPAGRLTGFKIIPREELGRPRVDVVLSATGLYRDQLPNVMAHLTAAVAAVAELDEPGNPLRANALTLQRALMDEGVPGQEAWEMAVTRLFSSATGSYGTGLDDAALATDTWDEEGKLAELYLARMQYAYGPDPTRWGRRLEDRNLYADQLIGVEGAVLARSSNLYGMLTTDDPFQYLGGISLAVRHLTGSSPALHISNLRDPDNPRYQSAAQFLAMELRTRQFHPGWIQAMQAEGYAGTLELVDSLDNFWGWQVMDPAVVHDGQWQRFHQVYLEDRYELGIREWFENHNPHALAQMVERMLEAVRKEYWDADAETVASLAETHRDLQARHDVLTASSALDPWLETLGATGFGLDGAAPDALGGGGAAADTVQGQQLAPVQPAEPLGLPLAWLLLLPLALILIAGVLHQLRQQRRLAG